LEVLFNMIIDIIHNGVKVGERMIDDPALPPTSKMIDMGRLSELLPDAVILELEDFRADTGVTAAKRKAAARILLIIASSRQWDVYGSDYTALMTKLANNTALTGVEATAITDELKA